MSDLPEDTQPASEPETPVEAAPVGFETLTLTQHWLGMEPYVLITLTPSDDDPDEPAVKVEVGGGAEEEPMALLLFAVTGTVAEGNRVAQMLRDVYRDTGPTTTGASAVERITREFNPDWLDYVTAD